MWWKLDDHDNHFCDACKRSRLVGSSLRSAKQTFASTDSPAPTQKTRLSRLGRGPFPLSPTPDRYPASRSLEVRARLPLASPTARLPEIISSFVSELDLQDGRAGRQVG